MDKVHRVRSDVIVNSNDILKLNIRFIFTKELKLKNKTKHIIVTSLISYVSKI